MSGGRRPHSSDTTRRLLRSGDSEFPPSLSLVAWGSSRGRVLVPSLTLPHDSKPTLLPSPIAQGPSLASWKHLSLSTRSKHADEGGEDVPLPSTSRPQTLRSCKAVPLAPVYCWGLNSVGQCGGGLSPAVLSPIPLGGLPTTSPLFVDCAAGRGHTLLSTHHGDVIGWGDNSAGQLGLLGDSIPSPVVLSSLKHIRVAKVACGARHSLCASIDGLVFTFGSNDKGQLGVGGGEDGGGCVGREGNVASRGPSLLLGLPPSVVAIAAGPDFNCAITNSGQAWAWGACGSGQLGIGRCVEACSVPTLIDESSLSFTNAACGEEHMLLLSSKGLVFSCGNSHFGRLGHANTTRGQTSLCLLPRPVELPLWPHSPSPSSSRHSPSSSSEFICTISAGGATSAAVDNKGRLFMWGGNQYGQLCARSISHSVLPQVVKQFQVERIRVRTVCVGFQHVVALSTAGNVYAWGCRSDGQLGDSVAFDGPDNIVFSPVLISALTTMSIHVSLAAVGGAHCVVIREESASRAQPSGAPHAPNCYLVSESLSISAAYHSHVFKPTVFKGLPPQCGCSISCLVVLLDSLEKRCHLSSTANITVLTRQAGKERFSPCASESVVTPDGSYTVNFTPACLPGPVDIRVGLSLPPIEFEDIGVSRDGPITISLVPCLNSFTVVTVVDPVAIVDTPCLVSARFRCCGLLAEHVKLGAKARHGSPAVIFDVGKLQCVSPDLWEVPISLMFASPGRADVDFFATAFDVHTAAFVGVTVCASAPSPRHCSMDGSQLPSLLFLPHRGSCARSTHSLPLVMLNEACIRVACDPKDVVVKAFCDGEHVLHAARVEVVGEGSATVEAFGTVEDQSALICRFTPNKAGNWSLVPEYCGVPFGNGERVDVTVKLASVSWADMSAVIGIVSQKGSCVSVDCGGFLCVAPWETLRLDSAELCPPIALSLAGEMSETRELAIPSDTPCSILPPGVYEGVWLCGGEAISGAPTLTLSVATLSSASLARCGVIWGFISSDFSFALPHSPHSLGPALTLPGSWIPSCFSSSREAQSLSAGIPPGVTAVTLVREPSCGLEGLFAQYVAFLRSLPSGTSPECVIRHAAVLAVLATGGETTGVEDEAREATETGLPPLLTLSALVGLLRCRTPCLWSPWKGQRSDSRPLLFLSRAVLLHALLSSTSHMSTLSSLFWASRPEPLDGTSVVWCLPHSTPAQCPPSLLLDFSTHVLSSSSRPTSGPVFIVSLQSGHVNLA